eukprot:1180497-Prorocentrum_minimum.AAC.5
MLIFYKLKFSPVRVPGTYLGIRFIPVYVYLEYLRGIPHRNCATGRALVATPFTLALAPSQRVRVSQISDLRSAKITIPFTIGAQVNVVRNGAQENVKESGGGFRPRGGYYVQEEYSTHNHNDHFDFAFSKFGNATLEFVFPLTYICHICHIGLLKYLYKFVSNMCIVAGSYNGRFPHEGPLELPTQNFRRITHHDSYRPMATSQIIHIA